MTIADAFRKDPRITQGKAFLLEALEDYQDHIQGVKPPDPERRLSYEQLLKHFEKLRGGKLYYPYVGSGIGKGALVELIDGSIKYDFISGIGPHYWGHSHPEILSSCIDAALSDTVMQGHLQQNSDSITLSEILVKASGLDHCFLTSSGAMANENSLKIAFQKRFPANRLLAFEHCFAGRTLAIASITDKPQYREGLPSTLAVDYVPFCTDQTIPMLKQHLKRYPKQHAAMMLELVQGEGGFYPGSKECFHAIASLLKEEGIAFLVDEVQTFGRTTELFAFQHFELQDVVDIVSIGKLSQICATLFRKEWAPKPGLLSQTFTASSSAIRSGLTMIEGLLKKGYFGPDGKIVHLHNHFVKGLEAIAKKHPKMVSGPYGIGAMIAFTPFDGSKEKVLPFAQTLFESGVISFITGSEPLRIRFLIPAGALTLNDIDEALKIVEKTLVRNACQSI
ncbi:MAG: aminotransferase class III-fold pyridoxal phosphate-dependent enzyme [Chlamydiia bacterium]|nr:aminotransferase class III-fold pyridoxal phosphate-dependent enzyme [Chlamydiia bacterium]